MNLARREVAEDPLAELLARCAAGDRVACRSLYDLQSARLYGLALRLTRQPALAADAVHDAFLQIWQRASQFDPSKGQASAWLAALLRYRAIDLMRRRSREAYGFEPVEEADHDPDPLVRLAANEEAGALRRCLEELDEHHRRAVMLAFVDGLNYSQLATALDLPLGTVKSWVRRALLGLRERLEE